VSDRFEVGAQPRGVHVARNPQPRASGEQEAARHRSALPIGGELLDVHAVPAQHLREVADDAGMVLAHDLEVDLLDRARRRLRPAHGHDPQPQRLELRERRFEARDALGRHLDAEDPRELTGELCHPALQPVATVDGDLLRHGLDEAGPVGPDEGQDEVGHASPPILAIMARPRLASP
jgi:hypothetical protein